jgi:Zn ribbon nucleic-acid-binding protein
MAAVKKRMHKAVCPECHATGTIRNISYGYPQDETALDPEVILGGCIVYENETRIHGCLQCGWEGTFRNGKVFVEPSPVEKLEASLEEVSISIRHSDQAEEVKYILLRFIREAYPNIAFDDSTLRR